MYINKLFVPAMLVLSGLAQARPADDDGAIEAQDTSLLTAAANLALLPRQDPDSSDPDKRAVEFNARDDDPSTQDLGTRQDDQSGQDLDARQDDQSTQDLGARQDDSSPQDLSSRAPAPEAKLFRHRCRGNQYWDRLRRRCRYRPFPRPRCPFRQRPYCLRGQRDWVPYDENNPFCWDRPGSRTFCSRPGREGATVIILGGGEGGGLGGGLGQELGQALGGGAN
ncbi:hypothetical protein GGR51DRAFT_387006 [Nemania sp. FL0031]|nr:hypothetical protein GGR51DRAFT_387006 [Nemania sp. FL0031]